MKITRIRIGRVRAALHTPFVTALRRVESVENLVLAVDTSSGHTGYGEAPATAAITGETLPSIEAAVRDVLGPQLIGQDAREFHRLSVQTEQAIVGNTSAKAAIDMALYDLAAQHAGLPLVRLLGGAPITLRTDITISLSDVHNMVQDSKDAVARGFSTLKIKLGNGSASDDVQRVAQIAASVPIETLLILDANQAWSAKTALHIMRSIEAQGIAIELLEQPVKAHDLDGLRTVTHGIKTRVMADESVMSPREAAQLIQSRAADVINIKLMKCGGVRNALRIADLAAAQGIPCMMGSMLESSISVCAAAHVAGARPETIQYVDLDGPLLCKAIPVETGLGVSGANLTLSESAGLGVQSEAGFQLL